LIDDAKHLRGWFGQRNSNGSRFQNVLEDIRSKVMSVVGTNEKDKDKIKKMPLSSCIKEYVEDNKIKSVAKRAIWLGNDETHYIKKWEGKKLTDLKKLIELTIHWIEMEKLTQSFENDMPDKE